MSIRIMTRAWDVQVGMAEKLVLLALADIADDEGHCFPSLSHLGRKCGMHRATVLRALSELESDGHLTRDSRSGRSSIYTIHPSHDATGTSSAQLPVANCDPSQSATPPVAQSDRTRRTERLHPSQSATHIRHLPANYPPREPGEGAHARDGVGGSDVPHGTIDAGDALTRSLSAENVLAEMWGAWRDVEDVDHGAMNAWLAHWSRVHSGRDMPSHQRIAAAKLLAGLGDADTQRRAVQTAEANGWKALRLGDGRAPPKSKADQAADARKESERIEWQNLRERAERVEFRMPTAHDDLGGYRALVDRAERSQPRQGAKPLAELLRGRAQ